MVHRFCAICGKNLNGDAPHFGMCLECYLKEQDLFELPKKFTFRTCLDCGSFSIKEEWIKPEENEIYSIIDEAVHRFLLKTISKKNEFDFDISFNEESLKFSSKDLLISLELFIRGSLRNNEKIFHQHQITININYELCKNCTNIRGGMYFISIMQLRVKDERHFGLIKEVLDYIYKSVEDKFDTDHRQYITKTVDAKYGIDLYLSTNELLNYIIRILKGKYHFLLKRSKKLVGRDSQRGKNIYRQKVLLKFLPFNRNDEILIDDDEFIVENISKNKIILRNKNGSKLIKTYEYFFNKNVMNKNQQEDL
ncbi:MAG: NMD3-related protein [Promethearchaeota archaeon]